MNNAERRRCELKLRSVSAQAQSLAEDINEGKLWEGDYSRRLYAIAEELEWAKRSNQSERTKDQ